MATIKDRIEAVRAEIAESAAGAGRDVSAIKLLAVTKTRTAEEILEAAPFADGLGENRVQEAELKKRGSPALAGLKAEWRLIGHLQGNKARKAILLFDSLDSIDSEDIAGTVERIAAELNRTVPILIEVNTSGEGSKTGVGPAGFPALLDRVLACSHIRPDGLMTIGPLNGGELQVRSAFAMLRDMAEDARTRSGLPLPILSMGMSGDFGMAIAEGSTMVRIGTSLFGPRSAAL